MEPSQSQVLCEPLLAAMLQLKEKPCQGVRTWNPALHPGQFIGNSRTAIGLRFACSETASDPVVAPNNGPTWSQKNKGCLDKINSTPDGKFYNFMSPLSMIPGIGPEWKSSIAEDVGGGAAKFAVFKFFQGASQTMVRTPFGSMSGFVAGSIEGVAEGVLAPVAAAATVGQLTVHAGCAISAAF
jgi:hypothetical protein